MWSGLKVSNVPPVDLPEEHWTAALFTRVGVLLDAILLRALALVVDAALAPAAQRTDALRAAAEPYLRDELQREPRRFFDFVDKMPRRMPVPVSERLRRTLNGGVVVARQFLSNYQPFSPRDDAVAECSENERVPVEHWMHEPQRPKATVLALHGFSMGYPGIDAFALMAAEWFKRGLDVALLTLPFHGARSPQSARFSGEAFASADVGRLNEAVRQAVSDVHALMNWLRQTSGAPVGLLGLSLGGYISALVAGLSTAPAFVIPLVPPVDIADLGWRFYERGRRRRRGQEPPLSRAEHEAAYRVHSPLTFALQVPKERVLIVAGRGDRVVPAEHPQALWLHWGKPALLWFTGSHVAPFGRRRIIARIVEHLASIGIL